jgi:hypothetical protein
MARLAVSVNRPRAGGCVGLLAIRWAFPELANHPERFAFPTEDLARYGARWWAYFLPPVYHPLFGQATRETLRQAGLVLGTLELQLSLSWSLIALVMPPVALWAMAALLLLIGVTLVRRRQAV